MSKIITAIKAYAKKLEKASVWTKSRKPIGLALEGDKDFIYEFYCFLNVLVDLNPTYKLEYQPGRGKDENRFPHGPADKKNKPYFKLYENGVYKYQICAGTKIKAAFDGKKVAPDISFQKATAAEDLPLHTDVKIIMDAKNSDVQQSQYDSFCIMIKNLKTENAENEKLVLKRFSKVKGNCIISSGQAYTRNIEELKYHKLSEIENLDEKSKPNIITY